MTERELEWLHAHAKLFSRIVEIGTWKGRSTSALAASGNEVIAVDSWLGEPGHEPFYGELATARESVMNAARGNLARFPNVTLVEGTSADVTVDNIGMLFVDGGHSKPAVRADLLNLVPRVIKGGIVCGHDWQLRGVREAVLETFGNAKRGPVNLWWVGV